MKHISCYSVICISLIPFSIILLQVEAGRFCVEAGGTLSSLWARDSLVIKPVFLWFCEVYFLSFCYVHFSDSVQQICVEVGGTLSSLWARDSLGLGPLLRPARAVGQLESGTPGTLSALVAPPSFTCCVWAVFDSQFHVYCKKSHFIKCYWVTLIGAFYVYNKDLPGMETPNPVFCSWTPRAWTKFLRP